MRAVATPVEDRGRHIGIAKIIDRLANEIAAAHPLRILSTILGVPREQEPKILRLTNELFAGNDPDLQRAGVDRAEAIRELGLELFQLFAGIIEDRRKNPTDDLASVIANAQINGEPMGPRETLGYYLIKFSAGHATPKHPLAGVLRALIDHPVESDKLRHDIPRSARRAEEALSFDTRRHYMNRT